MNRSWFLAHWRRFAMQAALCGLLAITVGLAALATHQKRLALRLPLNDSPVNVGRLRVSLPVGWSAPAISEETSGGDAFFSDELLPDGKPGRRLSFRRTRTAGLPAPLEQLLRSSQVKEEHLTGSQNPRVIPAKVQNLEVAGWPGVMVTRINAILGGRRIQKEVLACAILPPAQAVVIRLDGSGEPDAADEELVRQMAEKVAVRESGGLLVRPESGGTVELGGGVFSPVPEHFCWNKSIADVNRTSRDLLVDGSAGYWTSIELIPCLWLPEDSEQTLVSLLSTRDREWRSGPVKKLADGMWQVDRVEGGSAVATFPSRAYCLSNGGDQAIIAIMHGGLHEDQLFDAAWKSISANVRFTATKNLAGLLQQGEEQVRQLATTGMERFVSAANGHDIWSLWDQSENADKQFWMQLDWGREISVEKPSLSVPEITPTDAAGDKEMEASAVWQGSRTNWSDHQFPAGRLAGLIQRLYANVPATETHQQTWHGRADLSAYSLSADRVNAIHGQRTTTQRWELRDGKLRNLLSGDEPQPPPAQYVPGGWLPLILGKISDQPMVLRTESFIGCEGIAPSELLTLTIGHVSGTAMKCVTVTVNGTGQVSRWWYDLDGALRYIDFAGGFRAQCNEPRAGGLREK